LATVKALLKDNPDLVLDKDSHGLTPLHGAAGFGHKAVAELLIPNKADVSAKNKDGDTPLRAAVQNGHKDVADLLRQHGGTE
jgi:ankyrin repeat protein